MTLTIDISAEAEQKLRVEAAKRGVNAAVAAASLVEQSLQPTAVPDIDCPDRSTLALFAKWADEDGTDDPAEIARREADWEELKRVLNEDSLSGRPIYP